MNIFSEFLNSKIDYKFIDEELHIMFNDDIFILFDTFSNILWCELVKARTQHEDTGDITVKYYTIIKVLKKRAETYDENNLEIMKSISKTSIKHIELVMKLLQIQGKAKKKIDMKETMTGINCFLIQKDTMNFLCLSCETRQSKEKKLLKCKGCLLAYYCDSKCQKNHWKAHKPNCYKKI